MLGHMYLRESKQRRADGSTVALSDLQGQALVAVAAIARPERFFTMLEAQGLRLAQTVALPDHFSFADWQCPAPPGHIL